jgi:hypothetical protein
MEWGSGVCEIPSVTRRIGSRSAFSPKWLMERIIKFDRWGPTANGRGNGGAQRTAVARHCDYWLWGYGLPTFIAGDFKGRI